MTATVDFGIITADLRLKAPVKCSCPVSAFCLFVHAMAPKDAIARAGTLLDTDERADALEHIKAGDPIRTGPAEGCYLLAETTA